MTTAALNTSHRIVALSLSPDAYLSSHWLGNSQWFGNLAIRVAMLLR